MIDKYQDKLDDRVDNGENCRNWIKWWI